MPRVKPKTKEYENHLHDQERLRDASREFGRLKEEALADVTERFGFPSAGKRADGPYNRGDDGPSFFLDLMYATADPRVTEIPPPIVGSAQEAQERLQRVHGREYRDLTTTATQGGGFVPTGSPPSYVADAFAASARAASVMSDVLPYRPLPPTGMELKAPRLTTSATVAIQATQNTGVSETDIVESLLANPIGTVSGQQDLSQQLYDRSDPAMADVVLAEELGRALGEAFDKQVLAGTGGSGQMLGLRAVTGIVSNAYTDASATQAEAWPIVNKTYSDTATALGNIPTATLLHPRRFAWFTNWKDTATGAQSPIKWAAEPVQVPGIATNYGTNEDEMYVIRAEELPVYSSPPVFRVSFDVAGSGTLTAKITAYQYVSALFTRRPEAIGKVSGTGLIAPVFA